MFAWSWEPGILIGLALQIGAYLACVGPLRRWFPGSARVPQHQIQLFLLGVLILFIALVSPLGILSDGYLFSAHMVQHLLVTLIAPPLLLLGTPRWLFQPLVRPRIGLAIGRALTNPLLVLLIYNLVFAIWHVPAYYEGSLNNAQIHALQHVLFIGTATLMWWPIFSPLDKLPPLSDPLKCMYLFVASIPGTILGAIITFTDDVLYPTYARTASLGHHSQRRSDHCRTQHVDRRSADLSGAADGVLLPLAPRRRVCVEPRHASSGQLSVTCVGPHSRSAKSEGRLEIS